MPSLRNSARIVFPVLLLLALYWPGLTTWFYQDDFGWLNLRHDVHSARDLAGALFAPKAHGNMRPLGENAYWLGLSAVFGAAPLGFHVCTLVTQWASLVLLGSIVSRLVGWGPAGLFAQGLWAINIGVAPAMGWSSIYNQVLSGFFLLLAFYFLMRFMESGRRVDEVGQWMAFVMGLGALEINIVYPALAAVYVGLYGGWGVRKSSPGLGPDGPITNRSAGFHPAPQGALWKHVGAAWKHVLVMFVVSGAAVIAHFHFAPVAHAGVYAPRVSAAMLTTLCTYWRWVLGPMPEVAAGLVALAVVGLIGWGVRRGDYAPVVGAAWFLLPLLPYLSLPDHKMDYYLAVPATGIAMLGAYGVSRWRNFGATARVLTVVACLGYAAPSVKASWTVTTWQHARGQRVEDLVLGVEEVHGTAPGKIILLTGIDNDLFWSGVADLPFRAESIPGVYLAPGSEAGIQAAPELLSRYVLPEAIARRALVRGGAEVYRFDGQMLHKVKDAGAPWTEEDPRFVNIGDPVFAEYVGAGWGESVDWCRRLKGTGVASMAGPRSAGESLYIGVFETREFVPRVRVNGITAPAALVHRDLDLSEFRVTLPAEAAGWKRMAVEIENPTGFDEGLLFGYVEVR